VLWGTGVTGRRSARLHNGRTATLVPTPQQRADLAGGVYTGGLSAGAASFINVPPADPGIFRTSDTDWGPSS
jgi:hypothetical protein